MVAHTHDGGGDERHEHEIDESVEAGTREREWRSEEPHFTSFARCNVP